MHADDRYFECGDLSEVSLANDAGVTIAVCKVTCFDATCIPDKAIALGTNGGDTLVVSSQLMEKPFTIRFRDGAGAEIGEQSFAPRFQADTCCGGPGQWDTMTTTIQ